LRLALNLPLVMMAAQYQASHGIPREACCRLLFQSRKADNVVALQLAGVQAFRMGARSDRYFDVKHCILIRRLPFAGLGVMKLYANSLEFWHVRASRSKPPMDLDRGRLARAHVFCAFMLRG